MARSSLLALLLAALLLVLLLAAAPSEAVDKKNFKTCQQSGFCRRNRKLSDHPRVSPYSLVPGSLAFHDDRLTADILSAETKVLFTFELDLYQGNTARFRIAEKTPLRPRYEVKDVVIGTPKPARYTKTEDDKAVTLEFDGGSKAVLQRAPFRLDFLVGGEAVLSVNSRGLLNFEHSRTRTPAPPAKAEGEELTHAEQLAAEDHKLAEAQEKEDGWWEEDFKSHQDRKPHGPTAVALDFSFPGSVGVYGIPEHASAMALKTTKGGGVESDPYRLYNLDVFEYELDVPMALYGAVPYLISHRPGRTCGLLWLNAAETWIDVSRPAEGSIIGSFLGTAKEEVATHWMSESGVIDVHVFLGPTPRDVFAQYARLTGTAELPPLFALAYHQCRWNYNDEADVRKVDAGFDEHDIPYDVLWLDIEHTDGKKYFTWDPHKFPTPLLMQANLAEKRRKMVTIVDPHIKREGGYYIHQEAGNLGLYVKTHDGADFEGHCWPGSSSWVDFTNPDAREWWASKFGTAQYQGSTADLSIWNDMNEPSVFNGPEVTMHKHNVHHGGWEHRDLHNLYGFYQHMATAHGLRRRDGRRPFVLSRAFFAGSQRFGAVWTGDNSADWAHLRASTPMLLSLGLAGIPFAGADVGGFFGNPEGELLTRWYQAGAFQPFFRGHAHLDSKRREPWLKGEPYTSHIRRAIKTRYALLPLWYTLFHEASLTGAPVIRPVFVEFPDDEATWAMDDQFLVGDRLLVRPITTEGQTSAEVYLPGDGLPWYDYENDQRFYGGKRVTVPSRLERIPVFVRGGTVVPKKERPRRSSSLMVNDPYTLVVALNAHREAAGDVYLDDHVSYDYEKGLYAWKRITFKDGVLESKDAQTGGKLASQVSVERIVVLGLPQEPAKITSSHGKTLQFTYAKETQKLTIKLPGVLIAEDWSITLQ